jgi:hypothetical protein
MFLNVRWGVVCMLFLHVCSALAAEPHFDRVEAFGKDMVLFHFETDANRTYELQYTTTLQCLTNSLGCRSNAAPSGSWSNLTVIPRAPFPNHYVLWDYRTNSQRRFYRLRVTP